MTSGGSLQTSSASELPLAGIIATATDAIITVNERQEIVLFNHAAEKMFGYAARDILGETLDRLIPARFRAGHKAHVRGFGETGETIRRMGSLEVRAVRADGTEFPIEATISQVASGGEKYFTVVPRDITERFQAAEQMARLAAIVDSADDAILSKRLDGTITSWNLGAERIFGFLPEEMIGQSITKIIPPDRLHEEEMILQRIGEGEKIQHFETRRLRKDGTQV